ncbi:MAG: hypothetical protein ACLS48_12360 [[Eubacterium] siraeum]
MENGVNNVYTTKDNPEMFVYMTVTLLKISGNSAEFKIEAAISYEQEEFTFEGRGYSVDSSNSGGQTVAPDSNYTPSVKPTIPTINNCSVCHGSGLCQVCHGRGGMSYNTYGQGGDGWVVCQGCKGTEDVSIATEREKIKYKQSRSNNCGSVFCFGNNSQQTFLC